MSSLVFIGVEGHGAARQENTVAQEFLITIIALLTGDIRLTLASWLLTMPT